MKNLPFLFTFSIKIFTLWIKAKHRPSIRIAFTDNSQTSMCDLASTLKINTAANEGASTGSLHMLETGNQISTKPHFSISDDVLLKETSWSRLEGYLTIGLVIIVIVLYRQKTLFEHACDCLKKYFSLLLALKRPGSRETGRVAFISFGAELVSFFL